VQAAAVFFMILCMLVCAGSNGSLKQLAMTLQRAWVPVLELVFSLLIVGSMLSMFILTFIDYASEDLSTNFDTTLNTLTAYSVSGWFDVYFSKIRNQMKDSRDDIMLERFSYAVIHYLPPLLMFFLYSRLTLTVILLSFRAAKCKRQAEDALARDGDGDHAAADMLRQLLPLRRISPAANLRLLLRMTQPSRCKELPDQKESLTLLHRHRLMSKHWTFGGDERPGSAAHIVKALLPKELRQFQMDLSDGVLACNAPMLRRALRLVDQGYASLHAEL
jgi:hypothetical protein